MNLDLTIQQKRLVFIRFSMSGNEGGFLSFNLEFQVATDQHHVFRDCDYNYLRLSFGGILKVVFNIKKANHISGLAF